MSYGSDVAAAQVASEVTSKCIEWLGGVGITREFPAEKYYRDCKVGKLIMLEITTWNFLIFFSNCHHYHHYVTGYFCVQQNCSLHGKLWINKLEKGVV